MLPFCGYHMADYFKHWLEFGESLSSPLPIFGVNWFRTGEDGKFLWPGYGENMRALQWIVDRANGYASAVKSPLGWIPSYSDLTWDGLDGFSTEQFERLTNINSAHWQEELKQHDELFEKIGAKLPAELLSIRADFGSRFVSAM
jgi:phosphoenolpyruvate carboxykinase (GTP)